MCVHAYARVCVFKKVQFSKLDIIEMAYKKMVTSVIMDSYNKCYVNLKQNAIDLYRLIQEELHVSA